MPGGLKQYFEGKIQKVLPGEIDEGERIKASFNNQGKTESYYGVVQKITKTGLSIFNFKLVKSLIDSFGSNLITPAILLVSTSTRLIDLNFGKASSVLA